MPDGVRPPERSVVEWKHARGAIDLSRPGVMAVVNVTPDSFSDGGRFMADGGAPPSVSVVVQQCARWIEAGATLLDIGGESTRPGAEPVSPDEEQRRVLPVIEGLRRSAVADAVISVDTRRASVAAAALSAGADIVNDVSGLSDPDMASVVARADAGLCIGHLRGVPATMQRDVAFGDLVAEVGAELGEAVGFAMAAGVERSRIVVDPGIGFGKTAEHSAALVVAAAELEASTGRPVLIGASRKSFIGAITGRPVDRRVVGSVAAAVLAVARGARMVRAHDVDETLEALAVANAIERARLAVAGLGEGGAA